MSGPALLAFAKKDDSKENEDSIYKYLEDAGFEPEEVRSWGRIGSLVEALKEDEGGPCKGSSLDDSFIEFIRNLPPGNTPKPHIRHQMQRSPNI